MSGLNRRQLDQCKDDCEDISKYAKHLVQWKVLLLLQLSQGSSYVSFNILIYKLSSFNLYVSRGMINEATGPQNEEKKTFESLLV